MADRPQISYSQEKIAVYRAHFIDVGIRDLSCCLARTRFSFHHKRN